MNKLLKKTLLLGAAALTLAGTLPFSSVAFADGKELNLSVSSDPVTLDPAKASDSASGAVIRQVFEGLTREVNGKYEPAAATEWKISDDGLTYTFKLREGATWTNGDPVTAKDFEFAWKRAINPETAADYAPLYFVIEGAEAYNTGEGKAEDVAIKAVDDYTLEVKLTSPTAYFLELTAFYAFAPVNQKTVEADEKWAAEAGEQYVTNGAFELSSWNHGADYTLEKSDTYWDKDKVALDKVNTQIVESEATAVNMFRSGEIDYLGAPFGSVSLDSIDGFKADGSLAITPISGVYWYKVNTQDPVMANANIRKALALSIDRKGLIENITKGEQVPATSAVPGTVEGFGESLFGDADYEKAKEYLAKGLEELGKTADEVTVKLSINTSEAHSAIAQYIQEGWNKNLGLKTEIDNTEWQVYLDRLKTGDFQVARLGWVADYNDATTFLAQYVKADAPNNYTGWENAEYTKLLEEAGKEQDTAKRTELLKKAEAILVDEMPALPIYFYTHLSVAKPSVKNLTVSPLQTVDLKSVDVE